MGELSSALFDRCFRLYSDSVPVVTSRRSPPGSDALVYRYFSRSRSNATNCSSARRIEPRESTGLFSPVLVPFTISGEIGIRTRDAGFPTYRISNPARDSHNGLSSQELAARGEPVLPTSLPFSLENDLDLRLVVEAWPTLGDALKRAILVLVDSAPVADRGRSDR